MKFIAVALLVSTMCAVAGCGRFFGLREVPEGVSITLRARPGTLPTDPGQVMEDAQKVILTRVKGMRGVVESTVSVKGSDRLLVELPGIQDGKSAADALTRSALLEFYYLKDIQSQRNRTAKWRINISSDSNRYSFESVDGTKKIDSDTEPKRLMKEVVNAYDPVKNPNGVKPILTSADLLPNAKADLSANNGPIIRIEFNEKGTQVFGKFTRSHIGEYLAIFYDGKLLTAPVIQSAIPNGEAQISGSKSVSDANDIAQAVNGGVLPVPFEVVTIEKLPER